MNEVIDVGDDGLEMNVRLDAIIHSSLDTINKIYRSCAIVNDNLGNVFVSFKILL